MDRGQSALESTTNSTRGFWIAAIAAVSVAWLISSRDSQAVDGLLRERADLTGENRQLQQDVENLRVELAKTMAASSALAQLCSEARARCER
jgi:hypothetical protein